MEDGGCDGGRQRPGQRRWRRRCTRRVELRPSGAEPVAEVASGADSGDDADAVLSELVEGVQEEAAATSVQAAYRGYRVRKTPLKERSVPPEDAASDGATSRSGIASEADLAAEAEGAPVLDGGTPSDAENDTLSDSDSGVEGKEDDGTALKSSGMDSLKEGTVEQSDSGHEAAKQLEEEMEAPDEVLTQLVDEVSAYDAPEDTGGDEGKSVEDDALAVSAYDAPEDTGGDEGGSVEDDALAVGAAAGASVDASAYASLLAELEDMRRRLREAEAALQAGTAMVSELEETRRAAQRAEAVAESACEDRARLLEENEALRHELAHWRDRSEEAEAQATEARRDAAEHLERLDAERRDAAENLERLDAERRARARDSEAVRAVQELSVAAESSTGQWAQERAKLRGQLRRLRSDAERHRTAMAAYASQAVPLKHQLDELVARLCHESDVYGASPAVVNASLRSPERQVPMPSLAAQLTPSSTSSLSALRELRARRNHAVDVTSANKAVKLPSVAKVKNDGRYRTTRRPASAVASSLAAAASDLQEKRNAAIREINRIRRF